MSKLRDEYYDHILDGKEVPVEKEIVFEILSNMSARSGMDWGGCDTETIEEMMDTFINITKKCLNK